MVTERIERIRQNYVNTKPAISCERAWLWTESHKRTEGLPVCIRRARSGTSAFDSAPFFPLYWPGEMHWKGG